MRSTFGHVLQPLTRPLRLLGPLLACGGLLLLPWVLYMSIELPDTARARNWSLMWTGLDIAEAVALVATGILQWRGSRLRALPATVASVLLAVDAWIDVTTSAPGHATVTAVLMAVLVEVPAALLCVLVAVRAFPPGSAARRAAPAERGERQTSGI